jgi:hypothetical protein
MIDRSPFLTSSCFDQRKFATRDEKKDGQAAPISLPLRHFHFWRQNQIFFVAGGVGLTAHLNSIVVNDDDLLRPTQKVNSFTKEQKKKKRFKGTFTNLVKLLLVCLF